MVGVHRFAVEASLAASTLRLTCVLRASASRWMLAGCSRACACHVRISPGELFHDGNEETENSDAIPDGGG